MMDYDTDELEQIAHSAEAMERYEDTCDMIKKIVEKANKCGGLDSHQRNLLSVAYKSLVGTRRWAWRLICHSESRQSLHAAEQADGKTDIMLPDCKQKLKIESELDFICKSVISILDDRLIPTCLLSDKIIEEDMHEARVFYFKMKGDYYRYLTEVKKFEEKKRCAEESNKAYRSAFNVAKLHLKATDPIRLGLALNYSAFYYEVFASPDSAQAIAEQACIDAVTELENSQVHHCEESIIIIKLLHENMMSWSHEDSKKLCNNLSYVTFPKF